LQFIGESTKLCTHGVCASAIPCIAQPLRNSLIIALSMDSGMEGLWQSDSVGRIIYANARLLEYVLR
jgi:hypothetical protein